MRTFPKFQEEYSAKIPALALLCKLGWSYLSPSEALDARSGKANEVVLRNVLRMELHKRRFIFAGKDHPISDKSIDTIINEICSPVLNEGLGTANEKIYNHLLYGISVTEFIDGKKVNPTIPIVDWQKADNNSFVFTEEFCILRAQGYDYRKPDIVCFVNGIPLVVIEAKRPDGNSNKNPSIDEGISQNIRNQRIDEIPILFAYSQLLLSINGIDGRYGTQGTPSKFWTVWYDEDITSLQFNQIKNKKLSPTDTDAIFASRPADMRQWYEKLIADGKLEASGQDKILIGLLLHERLLEMIRYYILFDKKTGKIVARYQQVFGIKRLIDRINIRRPDNSREGGVIWHTTGSGKSFTMVFLSKALILDDRLKNCRLVIVTDRVDLERQLSGTFTTGGEFVGKKEKEAALATSGKRLAEQIGNGTERIIFTLIQKFNTAAKLPECYNDSSDLIVLVDEGHRSQGGENHTRMKLALPKAAFIAFTGTPLLKDDKTTNKFGPIIHAYTMQQAVADNTVTPILYEERKPDLDINERAIDSWFARITDGLTEDQRTDLKKKFAKKGQIYQSEDRIRLLALDIANHFVKNIDDGLKGQLATDSKTSAIKYKQFLDEAGLFESAVVMSPPDSREGNTDIDESNMPLVCKWWKENVGSQNESIYTKQVIERFENDDDLKLLIVVDKLLTGFDEPKNTVLYIDKHLKEHNLIQAIARVNRLHPLKKFGLLIDYRGILAELDSTIAKYQDLASRTQGGFDINDIAGLYNQMSTEYKKLPGLYKSLCDIFKGVNNKSDIEQLRQVLVPRMKEIDGEMVDINLKLRDDFYEALTEFSSCLKIALQSASFFEDKSFTDADRVTYKEAMMQFSSLRQLAKNDAGETIVYDTYQEQIRKLMDKHVVGVGVKEPGGVYEVGKMGKKQDPKEWSEEKTRNETDIIKTRVTKMIEQNLRNDPYAKEAFSKLLRKVIKDAEQLFEHPMKQYMLFLEFEEKVTQRKLEEIPDSFSGHQFAQAYYGVFKKVIPDTLEKVSKENKQEWVDLAFTVDQLVTNAVAEYSINPQNIETEIRKKLLPLIFTELKKNGMGIEQSKTIVEHIVQITRVGLV